MSDLIKMSLSLENCSFHPRGERSWAGSGLKNDLALKARAFPTRFGATRPGPAVRWVPPGYRQLAEEPRAGFLGIHHFHPLRSRHFIIWDHSVKQYDAAHFYLSRFTKPYSARREATKASERRCGRWRSPPARSARLKGNRAGGKQVAGARPSPPEGTRPARGPRAQVTSPRVWLGRDTPLPGPRPPAASPQVQASTTFPSRRTTRPPRPHRFFNHCRSIYWEQINSPFWKRFNCCLDGWGADAGVGAGPRGARRKGLVGKCGAQRPSATCGGSLELVRARGRPPQVPLRLHLGRCPGILEGPSGFLLMYSAPSGGGAGVSSAPAFLPCHVQASSPGSLIH